MPYPVSQSRVKHLIPFTIENRGNSDILNGRTYHEHQTADRIWLWLIGFETVCMLMLFFYADVPWPGILLVVMMSILTGYFLTKISLTLHLDRHGVHIEMRPVMFYGRSVNISWREIESVTIRKLEGFMEINNYGVRSGQHKKVYHLRGSHAVVFRLQTGKKVIVAIQKATELLELLQKEERPVGRSQFFS